MTWEVAVSFIGAVTGLIIALWGIVKYYDQKREAKQKKREELFEKLVIDNATSMRQQNEKQQQCFDKINNFIDDTSETINMLSVNLEKTQTNVQSLYDKLGEQEEHILENELSRLQTAIMDFAIGLRNGKDANLNSFNYIFHAYDKYKHLGGNSFIDSEFDYIKRKKKELEATQL